MGWAERANPNSRWYRARYGEPKPPIQKEEMYDLFSLIHKFIIDKICQTQSLLKRLLIRAQKT